MSDPQHLMVPYMVLHDLMLGVSTASNCVCMLFYGENLSDMYIATKNIELELLLFIKSYGTCLHLLPFQLSGTGSIYSFLDASVHFIWAFISLLMCITLFSVWLMLSSLWASFLELSSLVKEYLH